MLYPSKTPIIIAFWRKALENIAKHLTVKRYAFDIELLIVATARSYRIAKVPALWRSKLTSRFKNKRDDQDAHRLGSGS